MRATAILLENSWDTPGTHKGIIMGHNFADDTSVLTETEPSDNGEEREEKFDELLEGGEATPAPESDEPEPEPQETESVPEPAVVEGPSYAMKTVARQAGIPDALVDIAHDDAQLHKMVDLASKKEERASEPVPEFDIELPEDEYSQDDSVRKQFNSMKEFYTGQLDTLKQDMASVVGLVKGIESDQRDQTQQQAATQQADFDAVMDKLDSPVFGKYGELDESHGILRSAVYAKIDETHRSNPSMSYEEVVQSAAGAVVPGFTDNRTAKTQRKSLQEQSRSRLGSGNSRPAPEPEKAPDMVDFLIELQRRRAKK